MPIALPLLLCNISPLSASSPIRRTADWTMAGSPLSLQVQSSRRRVRDEGEASHDLCFMIVTAFLHQTDLRRALHMTSFDAQPGVHAWKRYCSRSCTTVKPFRSRPMCGLSFETPGALLGARVAAALNGSLSKAEVFVRCRMHHCRC